MDKERFRAVLRIPLYYVALAALWILFSDRLLNLFVSEPDLWMRLSLFKGWFFVLFTGALLVFLLRGEYAARLRARRNIELKNRQLDNLNRLYAVLSQTNQAITRIGDRETLFSAFCRIATDFGRFRMAWIGVNDQDRGLIPAAASQITPEDLATLLATSPDSAPEEATHLVALREGRPACRNDIDPGSSHDLARRLGYRSRASAPILFAADGGAAAVVAVLNVYGAEPDLFDAREMDLLDEIARDIAFALKTMDNEARRRRTENDLKESEERYRTLFFNDHAAMLIIHPESGAIVEANPAACAYYGYSRVELTGRAITDINTYPEPDVRQRMFEASTGRRNSFVARHRLANGQTRDVEVFSGPITLGGTRLLFSIIHDVSDRVLAERALVLAKEEAEAADKVKTQFLANMSHELRTPLHGIMGITQLLLQSAVSPKESELLEMTLASADKLMETFNNLLLLSKMDSERLLPLRQAFGLRALIESLRAPFTTEARALGLFLACEVAANAPETIMGDPTRLRHVLVNLLQNALRFTEKGGVTARVETVVPASGISAPDEVRLLFSVKDTGVGIPLDRQEKIFERFTLGEDLLTKKYGGSGIGLSIAAQLVAEMGGAIRVHSEPGKGSRFSFALPFALPAFRPLDAEQAASAATPSPEAKQSPASRAMALRPLRILYAEDDPVNQLFLKEMLQRAGHDVTLAEDGAIAIELLRDNSFDLALMDIQMPNVNGLEATRRIRGGEVEGADPRIPIIALTAYAGDNDMREGLRAGMDEYVAKPVDIDSLLRVIRRVVA